MSGLARREDSTSVKNISYGDLFAQLFLWQKALLLVPIWSIPFIPIVGFLCRSLGVWAVQLGFGLIIVAGVNYFLEDLLKRRIRLDDECLYFGFRTVRIEDIVTIDVKYKKRKLLPTALVLTTNTGQSLKLSLNGMTEQSLETLLKHLQSRNSNLKTAPVISTLVKCRRVVPKPVLDTQERLAIPYHSRQFVDESIETFKLTAQKWMRMGPALACVVAAPLWMMFLSTVYVCLQAQSFTQVQALNVNAFLGKVVVSGQQQFLTAVGEASTDAVTAATDPLVTFTACTVIAIFVFYLQYLFLRPNVLFADSSGITLQLRFGQMVVSLGRVLWSEILRAELLKPKNHSSSAMKMRLTKTNGKSFDVDLSFINPDDRARLLKRMERLIANCEISPDLSQSMLPKADRSYTEIWLQSLNQAPERKTLDPLEPGQSIADDRFEVLKTLGVGGQGTAYLCRDLSSKDGGTIVLKETILPIFVNEAVRRNALERFEKEARLLKSINSNGIVGLLDYFIEDHRAYLVLEHIDGSTLRDLVSREGAMSEQRVHDLALQMCGLLNLLHSNGIVHRDFTPDNLILNSKGQLKLIDFNVAQQIQEGATGTIVGKHAYVPPEQFRGKATSQSDLYAFGATLFYMLTGTDPEPISQSTPSEKNKGLSSAFDSTVRKLTALQTNRRFETAKEVESEILSINFSELQDEARLSVKLHQKEGVAEHG